MVGVLIMVSMPSTLVILGAVAIEMDKIPVNIIKFFLEYKIYLLQNLRDIFFTLGLRFLAGKYCCITSLVASVVTMVCCCPVA